MDRKIPIRNIYYMLCYAWDRLEEKDIVDVEAIDSTDLYELFTRVIVSDLNYLIKRGFYRQYSDLSEETKCIRGKLNFGKSLKNLSFINGKAFCEHDELNYNILHNQIIKTTMSILLNYKELDNNLKDKLMVLYQYFIDIDEIKLTDTTFSSLKLHKNNIYYSFLLNICELIYRNLLVDEKDGKTKFKDFFEDEKQMAYLFENFVRNFYKRELKNYKVFRENINWDSDDALYQYNKFLPIMQTDITVESNNRKIIIDTKYYKEVLNSNYDSKKVKSDNLYQIFAYLKNNEQKDGLNLKSEGILLYPEVVDGISLDYNIQNHKIMIRTINLNNEWKEIHDNLLKIIE